MFPGVTEQKNNVHYCLSCGTSEHVNKRRYCSVKCRQNLRQKLNMKSGLFQALNTRYASFYFSDTVIILDVVPYGIKEVFRYTRRRKENSNPASDFNVLTNKLGEEWWTVSNKTHKNYMATQHVLRLATRHAISDGCLRPRLLKIPTVRMACLHCLDMQKADLHARDLNVIIKNAYRRMAKIHHPDLGGHAATFRKIHDAYKELLRWADNPVYIHRRGFPDKWYYSGENKKWVQPTPAHE